MKTLRPAREFPASTSPLFEAAKSIRNAPMIPKRIRTYLIANIVFAILMVVVMDVRTDLRTGRHLVFNVLMIIAFSSLFAVLTVVPLALVEIYLYRKKKGVWYDLKQGPRRPAPDFAALPGELGRRKSDALRARLARGEEPMVNHENRTALFESSPGDEQVSRAALLLTVAVKLEGSGKREAAQTCYRQIVERFADSPAGREAAQRLASMAPT
jgi:hypothetical protein